MKLSKISTGKKLDYKTFDELKPGDTVYWTCSAEDDIKNTAFKITGVYTGGTRRTECYTDLNPNKKVYTLRNIEFSCKDCDGMETNCEVPAGATYLVNYDVVFATSQELMLQVIKQYNVESYLK